MTNEYREHLEKRMGEAVERTNQLAEGLLGLVFMTKGEGIVYPRTMDKIIDAYRALVETITLTRLHNEQFPDDLNAHELRDQLNPVVKETEEHLRGLLNDYLVLHKNQQDILSSIDNLATKSQGE